MAFALGVVAVVISFCSGAAWRISKDAESLGDDKKSDAATVLAILWMLAALAAAFWAGRIS